MTKYFKSDIEKLKYHLTILLDTEINLLAEEIDREKVERILDLIEMCGNSIGVNDINKLADRFIADIRKI